MRLMMKKIFLACLTALLLSGCMPYHAEKAPCDQYATGCGGKTKVNQW